MLRVGVAVVCLGVALAGCSGGEDSKDESAAADTVSTAPPAATGQAQTSAPATSAAAPDQAALERAVRDYSAAYLGGDPAKAFGLLSKRCQLRLGQQQMADAVSMAKDQYGPQDITSLHVDTLQGTLARVTYTYADTTLNQSSEPWVAEGGQWREDDC